MVSCCKTRWDAVTQHERKEDNASEMRNKTAMKLGILVKTVCSLCEYIATDLPQLVQDFKKSLFLLLFSLPFILLSVVDELSVLVPQRHGIADSLSENRRN